MKLEIENGKYTITDERGSLEALRYGEPWRRLVGDNLVFAMASEIEEFRSRKEPWASCCTVATNRAIREFREEWPITEGTMVSIVSNEDGDTYFVQVVGLKTETTSKYSFESLGIEIEDLFAP